MKQTSSLTRSLSDAQERKAHHSEASIRFVIGELGAHAHSAITCALSKQYPDLEYRFIERAVHYTVVAAHLAHELPF